jgi:quercetin dioxygenase-like cupin family protein/ligand-binding sensor protein
MEIQKTDWGQIQWHQNYREKQLELGMNVGIVTINPGAQQPAHVHYEEQMVYILEGRGIAYIDGEALPLETGAIHHWKPGIIHETVNTQDSVLKHLLVTNPDGLDIDHIMTAENTPLKQVPESSLGASRARQLSIAVEAIRTQFLENMHYAYTIFDEQGNRLAQSQYFPQFCLDHCQSDISDGICACMVQKNKDSIKQEHSFVCPHGLVVFNSPIYFDKAFGGYIHGGYIHQSDSRMKTLNGVYDTPESTAVGIRTLIRKISRAISNFCEFNQFRNELIEKEIAIADSQQARITLMKNLQDAEYRMTELRINNHFLFNTLNSMAAMALEGGILTLYQSIVDLSKIFHYNLKSMGRIVPLQKEYEYLKAYLQLQKLRYGDNLKVHYQIDETALAWTVPFNFLQPIVENAFIHGFTPGEPQKITVSIEEIKESLRITIKNNGCIIDQETCNAINLRMRSNTAHGLSMVYHKLEAVYGQHFFFEVMSAVDGETQFEIRVPLMRHDMEGAGHYD